jgi:hypothetical protein
MLEVEHVINHMYGKDVTSSCTCVQGHSSRSSGAATLGDRFQVAAKCIMKLILQMKISDFLHSKMIELLSHITGN